MKAIKEITRKIVVCISIITASLLVNSELYAQDQGQGAVYLKNGSIIKGEITEVIPSEEVRIQTKDGSLFVYDINEVERIEMKEADTDIIHQQESLSEERPIDEMNKWTGNVNFFVGGKNLSDEDKWEPLNSNSANLGILVDFKPPNWPVSMSIDVFHLELNDKSFNVNDNEPEFQEGYAEGEHHEGSTTELHLGVRKIWDNHSIVRPFIGGGLALIKAEYNVSGLGGELHNTDDTGVGIWLEGGTYFTLAKHFNLGLTCRWSKADVTLKGRYMEDISLDAGGWQYGAILGYHW